MKDKNYCDECGKETTEAYELNNGDYVCLSCYEDYVGKWEAQYDSMREEGLV